MSDQQSTLTIEVVSIEQSAGGVEQSIEDRKERILIFNIGEIVD